MATLQAVKEKSGGDAGNIAEEKKDQQGTTKDVENVSFYEWMKAKAPRRKHKIVKKDNFSEEMLKAIDSQGRDITSWREYLDQAKLCFDKRMRNKHMPQVRKVDFTFLKTLGTGAFSKVLLVKHIDTKTYYAAKLLTKYVLVRDGYINHARNEKLILQSIRFVFTVHLEFFFQDNVFIFFVLPFISGGDLFTYLSRKNGLKEDQARFYSAQMLLAFEYLHYVGLIFRDLKPENILIDTTGYLKLTDFGFCKAINLRTYTFCGTAEYIAPEMLRNKGYGKSIDWWTFGVLLYEMCAGYTPFYSKIQSKTFDNISKCKYRIPSHFSNALSDLIKNILQEDLTKRYGNLKNGVDDIKEHNFYNNVPWIMLLNREIKAPYIPVIKKPDDTRHFERFNEKPLETTSVDLYYKEFADF